MFRMVYFMKRIVLFFILLVNILGASGKSPKYVFYFIGDGMGVNQVLATEMYKAELEGEIGLSPLCFTRFPVSTVASTYSATNSITDSAAGGTALATGVKTKNGAIGVMQDLKTEVSSVAVWAKNSGKRVGIATSVSVDHATPSAFYAHESSRNNYYEIGIDLYKAGFDFYAGSDFISPEDKNGNGSNLYEMADEYGYTIVRGYDDYKMKSKKSKKMILFQEEELSKRDRYSLPYAIDRTGSELNLENITKCAIDFLTKDCKNGFFLMVEGGKIDWACHSNDGATMVNEIIDFDNAIRVAYEFYLQHKDETLIVVTADHETGGISLGTGKYELNLKILEHQKNSESVFSTQVKKLRNRYGNGVPWDSVKDLLMDSFGFWDKVDVNEKNSERLMTIYEKSIKADDVKMEKSEYSLDEALAGEAKRIINELAYLGWNTGGHSAGYVPVFAIGVGSNNFTRRLNNIDLPNIIAKVAGYEKSR